MLSGREKSRVGVKVYSRVIMNLEASGLCAVLAEGTDEMA